jgi:hypothetical protein
MVPSLKVFAMWIPRLTIGSVTATHIVLCYSGIPLHVKTLYLPRITNFPTQNLIVHILCAPFRQERGVIGCMAAAKRLEVPIGAHDVAVNSLGTLGECGEETTRRIA